MRLLASILIVVNALGVAHADEWSAAHAKCYTEAMQLQTISIGYLQGKTRDQVVETLGGFPPLIQWIDRVFRDKPTDYEQYGVSVFLSCTSASRLTLDERRVRACIG